MQSGSGYATTVKFALWSLVMLFAAPLADAQSAAVAGTLPEDYLPGLKTILDTALKQSPQMIAREIEVSRNEARIYEESAQRYPNIGGNARYDSSQQSTTGSASSRNSGLFYSISLNQAVFHWGEIQHKAEVAKIDVAIAEKNYADAYRVLAGQLRQTYLGLIARHAELRQARFAQGLRNAELASVRERLSHGNASPLDLASRELAARESEVAIERLQIEFDAQRRLLSRLAGIRPVIPEEQIPSEIPLPKYEAAAASELLAATLRDGGRNALRVQAAELTAREADLNYRIARVRLLPKINAALNHERNSWTTVGGNSVGQTAITNNTIEVRADWTIFDGFATKGFKLEALAQKRAAERQGASEAEAVMDEAQRLERLVAVDAQAMDIAEQHRAGAANGVARAQDDLKAGRGAQTDVDAAKSVLQMAEWNVAMARTAYLSDWSAFVSATAGDPALAQLPYRYARATR